MTMTMDKEALSRTLAEFFLDSLREDAGDVANWCSQSDEPVDQLIADIERHFGMKA